MQLPRNSKLILLFLLQGAALGMWLVPLGGVLEAHGWRDLRPYAFAASATASVVAPLFFGAMADREISPVILLRWIALAAAVTSTLVSVALAQGGSWWLVLFLIQLTSLCLAPAWSLASTIVFSSLRDSTREFGPLRAMATLGWVLGCWVISGLQADRTSTFGLASAAASLAVAAVTTHLPILPPTSSVRDLSVSQRLGLDALGLLRNRDHRSILLATALLSIPMAAFYPLTPVHLVKLGIERTSAWMTLGQVTELIAMFSLAGILARWRVKWVMAVGLGFGVLRFALCALDNRFWILFGIVLHGCSYTLVFITAQIYLNERVALEWRGRAQALLALLTSGVGNGIGYLSTGWWWAANLRGTEVRWPRFWGGLAGYVVVLLVGFVWAYRGRGRMTKEITTS